MKKETKKCTSVCQQSLCELPEAHRGKHRMAGHSWSDGYLQAQEEKMWQELTKPAKEIKRS